VNHFVPSLPTLLLVGLFAVLYLVFLVRKTMRGLLDLYDLLMLSMVALAPALFVFFPGVSDWVAQVTGVAFPFVVMFGMLFVIVFLIVHRLTVKLHRLESVNRRLVQEISILIESVEQDRRSR